MPLQATSGAASYDAFGGGVAAVPNYIEDVFSTWLYTGNVTPLAITNGIDLSTYGGLIWTKERNNTASHLLIDSQRGLSGGFLRSNTTDAADTSRVSESISSFNTDGYSLHAPDTLWDRGSYNYVSWTFRKQPKFFDVVTYTGNGTDRTIAHNLGSVPGCIIIKAYSGSGAESEGWRVYHRSQGATKYAMLQSTNAFATASSVWNNTEPTSTNFTVGTDTGVNGTGLSHVAYIFAHDAGGFGLTGTDNVISCGGFTASGGSATVTLGYEPQWILFKKADNTGDWQIFDTMRGWSFSSLKPLNPNNSTAEQTETGMNSTDFQVPTATGFRISNWFQDGSWIYVAIRRGPMKVPTSGTSVFAPVAVASSTSNGTQIANSFVTDMAIGTWRDGVVEKGVNDRLRGISTTNPSGSGNPFLKTNTTGAETTPSNIIFQGNGNATMLGQYFAGQGYNQIYWLFGRAPSFFDEVCYTGTGSATTFTHNLGVVPELMIVKQRSSTTGWVVYVSALAASDYLVLNNTSASQTASTIWNSTAPTSSVFSVGTSTTTNTSAGTYVNYLFASCAGVSKVGSYTGNGSSQTINCGFTGGARFVLVKATSTTGNWIVADSARGIVAGNDPALYLNSTAAEVTGLDWIDADNSGFVVNETATIAANTNGVSYIFLAIA